MNLNEIARERAAAMQAGKGSAKWIRWSLDWADRFDEFYALAQQMNAQRDAVLAADRRPGLRGETPLVTIEQAMVMVAAERERCAKLCEDRSLALRMEGMGRQAIACDYCVRAIRDLD